jgi:N-acetyl-1-D-myo-inositol-2-amino-2-deoxy-alpha-D-glucopyranoside deacetylase
LILSTKLLIVARCLLICGAHPDDETFFAGTMAKYVSQGVRVCVLCGTRGERGNTADLCSIPELPQLREAELRRSMRVLGLRDEDVFFLPYEDQKLHLAQIEEARAHIVRVVREVKAQIVIGFDAHGANGHPDHVAMSRFVSDALPAAADERCCPDGGTPWVVQRLLWQPPHFPWRLPGGTNIGACFGTDFLIDVKRFAALKRAAILEHKTQLPGLERLYMLAGDTELTLDLEVFRLAWGPRPRQVPSSDLFEGLAI